MSFWREEMAESIKKQITKVKMQCTALSSSSVEQRNDLLLQICKGLQQDRNVILEANAEDLRNASALSESVKSRLKLDEAKLDSVIESIEDVVAQDDPIGKVLARRLLDDNLLLEKISVPLGVIGMVFEARPDAFLQIVSLCLKSGNCLVLKGGKEANLTNRVLYESIRRSCRGSFAGENWLLLLESHEDVKRMLEADGLVDLIIPRGSYELISYVKENTRIPVLGHADGLCAMYVDRSAFVGKAVACALDSKINYPAACNSIENLIVHKDIAKEFLPIMAKAFSENNVLIVGDERVSSIIRCARATEADWDTEYLGLEISILMVDSIDEAIDFIAHHTSHHTDAIIAEDELAMRKFLTKVDSADVFANCSTRFADGYRFGLGAEVGISTSKIHARGPVGLEGLMSSKYILQGRGQIVQTYMGSMCRPFKHQELSTEGVSQILNGIDGEEEEDE